METEITVALIVLVGSGIGTFGGILTSNKLVNHRIKALEERVKVHNDIVTRTYVLEEKVKVANHRINDIEKKVLQ